MSDGYSQALPGLRLALAAVVGVVVGAAVVEALVEVLTSAGSTRSRAAVDARPVQDAAAATSPGAPIGGIESLIGNTPCILVRSLSERTGCRILAKCEHMNPGGSGKDRVALQVIRDAEASGQLRPGGTLIEGTSGSTGVSLAMLGRSLGYSVRVVLPDDSAEEKAALLRRFGAEVQLVKPVSIVSDSHYVNIARRLAQTTENAVFCDQFETASNFTAHYTHTGPEIWTQTRGGVDGFVMGAGTGGTLAGVSAWLKRCKPAVVCALVDPPGSCLFNRVMHGVAYATQQSERTLRRHRYDTIIEGVGLDRITHNFSRALEHVDTAFTCTDQEAVAMSRFLLAQDGIFVGSSSAMNCIGAVKLARRLGPGHTIVTVLCDSGQRHLSRFWNPAFIASRGLDGTTPGDLGFVET